jgi:protoporphyrinogen oxidase
MAKERVAVVGAGIAGLAAAYELKCGGCEPVVFESSDCVGGRVKSIRRGGYVFDVGAFIYLGSYVESVALMDRVGLTPQLGRFNAYGAMPRDNHLKFLDFNKPVRTIYKTDYLSGAAKLKLLKLMFLLFKHWKHLNYHDAAGIAAVDTDTVQSYCDRELNRELYDYVASVVVRGPWLTNPADTSICQLLWTMKNFFKPYFYGLSGGMDALPTALAERLDVRLRCPVTSIADRGSQVTVTRNEQGVEVEESFDRCVIATPTPAALDIYPQMPPVQQEFYRNTTYISAVNTHLVLRSRPVNPATYIMVSPRENSALCGVIVDHRKADGRVPDGMGMLTIFCSDEWSKAHLDTEDEVIVRKALEFLRPYYGDLTNEVVDHEIGRWPVVVPKMKQGRFREIVAYQRSIEAGARVQLAGDLEPIGGVNAALVSGTKAAQRILAAIG